MIEQMDLFSLPEPIKYVRGSKTSLEAAIEAEPNAGTQRSFVLNLLRKCRDGLTDHQIQELLGMNPSTQRPRRVELVKAGLVKESGRFRLTPSGRKAVVWVAA